jgi:hypothetical protein
MPTDQVKISDLEKLKRIYGEMQRSRQTRIETLRSDFERFINIGELRIAFVEN